jgi:hypothetical protein
MVKNIGVLIVDFCMMMTKATYNDTLYTLLGGELYDGTGMKDYTLIDEYMYQIKESHIGVETKPDQKMYRHFTIEVNEIIIPLFQKDYQI